MRALLLLIVLLLLPVAAACSLALGIAYQDSLLFWSAGDEPFQTVEPTREHAPRETWRPGESLTFKLRTWSNYQGEARITRYLIRVFPVPGADGRAVMARENVLRVTSEVTIRPTSGLTLFPVAFPLPTWLPEGQYLIQQDVTFSPWLHQHQTTSYTRAFRVEGAAVTPRPAQNLLLSAR